MHQCRWVAVGADPHAQATVGADGPPEVQALLDIQLPFLGAPYHDLATFRDSSRGTVNGALETFLAEILDTERNRFVRQQRQVGGNGAETHAGPEAGGDQVADASQLTQSGIVGHRRQHNLVITARDMGPGRISQTPDVPG